MKYRKIAVGAIAVIGLAGAAAAPAVAAQWVPGKFVSKTAQGFGPDGPSVAAFINQAGPGVVRNQENLVQFKGWMAAQSGFKSSGYVWGIDDLEHKAMTLLWHGPRTPLLAKIVREGTRRGIRVTVRPFAHSMRQLYAASEAIWGQVAQGKWAGFHVSMVETINVANPDAGLTVQGTYTALPAARRAPQVRSLSTTVMGLPVHLQPGTQWVPTVNRDQDLVPFNAGDLMNSYYGHYFCSNGFAVLINGRSYTTTARHCAANDFVDAADDNLPSPPGTNEWYGKVFTQSPGNSGGAVVLGNYGWYWMFNHGPFSSTTSTVTEQVDPDGGTLVCTEGGNSGEHCNVQITGTGSYNDGVGVVPLDLAHQRTAGAIAVVPGDSGGPVMTITGTNEVNAAGMIQTGSTEIPGSNCGSVFDPVAACGAYVGFEPFGNVLSSFGAAGYPAVAYLG